MFDLKLSPGTTKLVADQMPEDWRASRLQDFCTFTQGGRLGLTKQDNFQSAGVPAYSAAGQDGFVERVEFHDTRAVVLSAIGANCGRCFYAEGNWTTLANVQVIIPNPNEVDARFLFYRVNRDDYWPRSGSAQPFVKPSDIKSCWVALPELVEQNSIARVLDTLDTAIRQTEAIIAKLKQVKQGLLHDLLTRGIDANGELRPPRSEAPHLYKASPLGWIPKEWQWKPFREIGRGPQLGLMVRGSSSGGENIGLLKMGNLLPDNQFDLAKVEPLEIQKIDGLEDYLLSDGDLLFNTRNTPDLVGKTCSWRDRFELTVFDNNILRMRVDQSIANGHFIASYMGGKVGRSRLLGLATGTTSVAAIYWKDLQKFILPLPATDEQNEIVACLSSCGLRVERECSVADSYRSLKKGLMDDLLTGRVRVTPLLAQAPATQP